MDLTEQTNAMRALEKENVPAFDFRVLEINALVLAERFLVPSRLHRRALKRREPKLSGFGRREKMYSPFAYVKARYSF